MHPRPITAQELEQILSDKTKDRFFSHVKIKGMDECWPWTAYCDHEGYGTFRLNSQRIVKTHRVAWMIENKIVVPEGLDILHSCVNSKSCCNPNHLRPGTDVENVADTRACGRLLKASGEHQGSHKLNEQQVLEIRELYTTGDYSQQKLADKFSVAKSLIQGIVTRNSWKHI